MPVNVNFGPAAGLTGQLGYGTGKRQYSDRRDMIEHQSKRQMLSDAMNFTKFLQDTRRPEEDQRRAFERMDKQQELQVKTLDHQQKIAEGRVRWETNFKKEFRTKQVEELEAGREKIEAAAKKKIAEDMDPNDVMKWKMDAFGFLDSKLTGAKPPAAIKPWETLEAIDGQTYNIDKNGDWNNLTAQADEAAGVKAKHALDVRKQESAEVFKMRELWDKSIESQLGFIKDDLVSLKEEFQLEMDSAAEWNAPGNPRKEEYRLQKAALIEKRENLLIKNEQNKLDEEAMILGAGSGGEAGGHSRERLRRLMEAKKRRGAEEVEGARSSQISDALKNPGGISEGLAEQIYNLGREPSPERVEPESGLDPAVLENLEVGRERLEKPRRDAISELAEGGGFGAKLASGKTVPSSYMVAAINNPAARAAFLKNDGSQQELDKFEEEHMANDVVSMDIPMPNGNIRKFKGKAHAGNLAKDISDDLAELAAQSENLEGALKGSTFIGPIKDIKRLIKEIEEIQKPRLDRVIEHGEDPHNYESGWEGSTKLEGVPKFMWLGEGMRGAAGVHVTKTSDRLKLLQSELTRALAGLNLALGNTKTPPPGAATDPESAVGALLQGTGTDVSKLHNYGDMQRQFHEGAKPGLAGRFSREEWYKMSAKRRKSYGPDYAPFNPLGEYDAARVGNLPFDQ